MEDEDVVAGVILATLYSHYNLDRPIGSLPPGLGPTEAETTGKEMVRERQISAKKEIFLIANRHKNPDIGAIHHSPSNQGYEGSEVDKDTAACAFVGSTLYFSINTKARRNPDSTPDNKIPGRTTFLRPIYPSLSQISESAWINLRTNLASELNDLASRSIRQNYYKIKELAWVAPIVEMTDEFQNAAFHAEMQLVSHFCYENTQLRHNTLEDFYIGVSKWCCYDCARMLIRLRGRFNCQHNSNPTNWRHPSLMQVMVKRREAIST